jgi:transcriptional regulator with XRE-family HTH domain
METIRSFAEALREARTSKGFSQEELAERAAMSVQGISALERGVRTRPYPATVGRLVEALALDGSDRAGFEAAARANPRLRPVRPAGDPQLDGDLLLQKVTGYAVAAALAIIREHAPSMLSPTGAS